MRTALLLLAALCVAQAADLADLALGTDGRLHLAVAGTEVCTFTPFTADLQWKFGAPVADPAPAADAPIRFTLPLGKEVLAGEATIADQAGAGAGAVSWSFTAANATPFNSLSLSADFAVQALAGGAWTADDRSGTFPALHGEAHLFNAAVRTLTLTIPGGKRLELAFPQPTMVTLQDNRRWGGQTFVVRIGRAMGTLAAGERSTVAMAVSVPGELRTRRDLPVTVAAGDDWVPLATELDIEPGSALDFAALGLTDGPCGSQGRVIATADGHFAYADEPHKPRRFYGVNLCFSSQYLAKEQVDRLLDRLVRLGYNSVRIHHYEFRLGSQDWKPGFDWDSARVDQLDYLMAGCAKRGLWLTTDLYVSRPVAPKQIGLGGDGLMKADRYKMLVPVHEPAFQDWATFARKLLDRVNPYTGRRLADDPALAWVSLINEGWIGGYAEVKASPQWAAAWNRWLAARYPERDALDLGLGDLADSEDPAAGSVALPAELNGQRRARLCQVFMADTERAMVERMRRLLRDELKCPALLTDLNYGSVSPTGQGVRATFDYVDDHFYVDHPPQLRLPVSGRYANPVRDGAPGGTTSAGARIWGKPFTVSEYNYTAPGRFRAMGGALTGALASLQDWDALWRFAYAHKDAELFAPTPMDWFNLASDPLGQAGDRAAILLYLRRDLAPAPQRLALVLTGAQLRDPPSRLKLGTLDWLAWTTRIGCAVVEEAAQAPADAIAVPVRGAGDRAALAASLAGRLALPAEGVQRSETGEVVIDSKRGVLTIDTPRSAGGYADPGSSIDAAKAGVRVDGLTFGATVLVSSLDAAPIRSAKRLLITHLTDLQNTGAQYNESSRQTLTAWGKLPHLVRDGAASVQIALADAGRYQVWALSGGGRRVEQIAAVAGPDGLTIPLRVRGAEGARMCYEVVIP